MKDLLDKIGSYNIFNYLLPGVLFAVAVDKTTSFQLLQKDIVVGAFVYYFFGSLVSRIGSLIIEPILKRYKLITFAPYEEYVRASKIDQKIDVLSEANNMYRTIVSLAVTIGFVALYDSAAKKWGCLYTYAPTILIVSIAALYLASYRKQTEFIKKRITVANEQK